MRPISPRTIAVPMIIIFFIVVITIYESRNNNPFDWGIMNARYKTRSKRFYIGILKNNRSIFEQRKPACYSSSIWIIWRRIINGANRGKQSKQRSSRGDHNNRYSKKYRNKHYHDAKVYRHANKRPIGRNMM